MKTSMLEMRFDPQTIKHLGLKMYATLPPALAELVSNSRDADASEVTILLKETNDTPSEIEVRDNGSGLSFDEINEKFLVIGRNRRISEGDLPSPIYNRMPTGKKGLGKLALFGLATTIKISTIKDGRLNEFILDWDTLLKSRDAYHPEIIIYDRPTKNSKGTIITLSGLKRKSAFDCNGLADSLSRIFIYDENFKLTIATSSGDRISVNNTRKYDSFDKEFSWDLKSAKILPEDSPYAGRLKGELMTSEKPLKPSTGLRGVTLFSRGKLVNAPEYFSESTSSHFYQYLTGWIEVDFIDMLEEDVISTNRQSLDWEHPDMAALRKFLSGIVSQIGIDWRIRRQEKKAKNLKDHTGIDTKIWLGTMSPDIKKEMTQILTALGSEDALETFTPVIKALHNIVPEYPELHWRHLHEKIRERIKLYYKTRQYGHAASEAVKIYCEVLRSLTGETTDGCSLVNPLFNYNPPSLPRIQINELKDESQKNIQEGQAHLSRGIIVGFRNPISHAPMDASVPAIFSELDCLNILSLASYILTRLDTAKVNPRP